MDKLAQILRELYNSERDKFRELNRKTAALWLAVGFLLTLFFAILPVQTDDGEKALSFTSVLPPLWAIIIAFALKRVFWALGVAILLASIFASGISPIEFIPYGAKRYFWGATVSQFKIYIFVFTTALVGMVNVSVRCGGMQGVVDKVASVAKSSRAARLATTFLGVLIFFDDYANTVVVGTTMRKLTDFYKVSREKLAFIVDSTAAPIAGLAVISTWIGYEVGLFGDIVARLGIERSGYEIFFSALPFRFYCVSALFVVFVNGFWGRDFGPMLKAERRAREGKLWADGANLLSGALSRAAPKEGIPHRWFNALIPIAGVIAFVFFGIILDGGGREKLFGDPLALFSFEFIRNCFAKSENNTRVLAHGSLFGSALAIILALSQRLLSFKEAFSAWLAGARAMLIAVFLLVLAWGVAAGAEDLGTAKYLTALLGSNIPSFLVPVSVFLLAGVVSFATGTSWGTMAILLPTTAPLAYSIGGEVIMVISMAAVLDGAIFGDHCSPISDTTVMSSIASACDHLDHVRTQMPYAAAAMVIAAAAGYLPVGWGMPNIIFYPLAFALIIFLFYILGKNK